MSWLTTDRVNNDPAKFRHIYLYIPEDLMGKFIGRDGRMIYWTERNLECTFKIHADRWYIIEGESHKAKFCASFCHRMIKENQFGITRASVLLDEMVREKRP